MSEQQGKFEDLMLQTKRGSVAVFVVEGTYDDQAEAPPLPDEVTHISQKLGQPVTIFASGPEPDPPVTRANDPVTSYRAETWLNESGRRESVAADIMRWLIRNPGHTYGEIADGMEVKDSRVWRRVSDLHKRGLIRPDGLRVWPETQREQRIWWPV